MRLHDPGEGTPVTHYMGDLMGVMQLGACVKVRMPILVKNQILRTLGCTGLCFIHPTCCVKDNIFLGGGGVMIPKS
jgi:hypothetical protein